MLREKSVFLGLNHIIQKRAKGGFQKSSRVQARSRVVFQGGNPRVLKRRPVLEERGGGGVTRQASYQLRGGNLREKP